MKPQNVILGPAGPRVLDFGIAHAADGTSVTRTGVMTGTPGWISPEHYRTGTAGPPGDMFAWGALVSYAATGRLPFGTGAPDVVAFRVMSGEAALDGVPGPLLTLLVRALAKEPEGRLTSEDAAGQCTALLASQTTQLLTSTPTTAGDPVAAQWDLPALDDPAWQGPPVRPRRRPLLTVGIGAARVGALAGGLLALSPETRQEQAGHSAPPTAPTGTGRATAAPPSGTQAGAGTGASPAADDSPSIATWRQARAAQTPAENDAGPSMGTGPWLDPVAHPDQDAPSSSGTPSAPTSTSAGPRSAPARTDTARPDTRRADANADGPYPAPEEWGTARGVHDRGAPAPAARRSGEPQVSAVG